MLAMQARGRSVRTIEGLSSTARSSTSGAWGQAEMHPIQEAFARHGAPQCGFCIPGTIMAAAALLEENPNPTEEEIRYGIAGNLCRCTGYTKFVAAIAEVAAADQKGA
jgi:carbon-monoxide dehydrogenase small subunit